MPTVEFERCFQAAHRLSGHDGKCSRIHGHNFKISVEIRTEALGDDGFVVDFERVKELVDRFDHRLILRDTDGIVDSLPAECADWIVRVPEDPTTEFMAQWFAEAIAGLFAPDEALKVGVDVLLRETDSIAARGSW